MGSSKGRGVKILIDGKPLVPVQEVGGAPKWNGPTYKDCKENPPPLLSLQSFLDDWATPLEYSLTAGTYKYDYILAPQWQPIETAPKDGSRFLVSLIARFEGDDDICIAHFSGVMWGDSPLWYDDEQNHMFEWSHWMPLPNPPPHEPPSNGS